MEGTGRGNTEAKCPLCSMVSCRERLVQGQSGFLGSSLGQNKGEKGNDHKSTSSERLARCWLRRSNGGLSSVALLDS